MDTARTLQGNRAVSHTRGTAGEQARTLEAGRANKKHVRNTKRARRAPPAAPGGPGGLQTPPRCRLPVLPARCCWGSMLKWRQGQGRDRQPMQAAWVPGTGSNAARTALRCCRQHCRRHCQPPPPPQQQQHLLLDVRLGAAMIQTLAGFALALQMVRKEGPLSEAPPTWCGIIISRARGWARGSAQ